MKQLIVNADDFGLAESVNDGIIAAHDFGILTSASLLANGSAFAHAVASGLQYPGLSLGVHLNLSSGAPVSDAALIPSLVNERGELYLSPVRLGHRTPLPAHTARTHSRRTSRPGYQDL